MPTSNTSFEKNNPLKAVILLGTLKSKQEFSHTEALSALLIENLEPYGVKCEVVKLGAYHIPPGTKSHMGRGDEWPKILKKLFQADIVIFATPIWWGLQSSLIQRVIERMDELNDELLETGQSAFSNKVGGLVITGAEDGVQHVTGNLMSFMTWNGFTLPPACALSYLGDYTGETKKSLLAKLQRQQSTSSMARTMARNLVFFACLLKKNRIHVEKKGIGKHIIPGSVGFLGDKK